MWLLDNWLLDNNSWLVSAQWHLVLIVVLRDFPSSAFRNYSLGVKSSNGGFDFI